MDDQAIGQLLDARQYRNRLVNWTKWRKIKQIGRRQTAAASEETLPVRYYDWIAHFGRRTPDKLAVVDLASERRFSYAQFDARISRLAAHLRDSTESRAATASRCWR